MTKTAENTTAKTEDKKYANLSATFMRATLKGQLKSIKAAGGLGTPKGVDFVNAIKAGDIKLPAERVDVYLQRACDELGLKLPDAIAYVKPEKKSKKSKKAEAADAPAAE
jgi:hypothetical protein